MTQDESRAQIDIGDYIVHPYEGKIWSKKQTRFLKGSNKHSYIYFRVGNDNYAFHRLIYEAFHGVKLTPEQHINHINRIRHDNRIDNLELVTNQQNTQWSTNRTGTYKGVVWREDRNKWRAELKYNYQNHFLGYYENGVEAAKAYNDFAQYLNDTQECKYLLNTINEPNYTPNPRNVPEELASSFNENKSCSQYIGVQFDKRRSTYMCQIKYKGKSFFLGSSKDPLVCAKLYDQQAAYFNTLEPDKYKLNDVNVMPKNIIEEKQKLANDKQTSKYNGVIFDKKRKKWRAYLVYNKKQLGLGFYDNEIDAAKAYNVKAIELNTLKEENGDKRSYKINEFK
jgi:hypothetical protein